MKKEFKLLQIDKPKPIVKTEDTGKIFEKAICLFFEIEFNGKFKYNIKEANEIKTLLDNLKLYFPYQKIIHSANNHGRYDFTAINDKGKEVYLSAKTTKGKGQSKVCPQVIGQPTKEKFCKINNLQILSTNDDIKLFIKNNLILLLNNYFEYTFDNNIIFYNNKTKKIIYIIKTKNIKWNDYKLILKCKKQEWNESTTLYIIIDNKEISIGEFQVHTHRNCIKFRWCFENLLNIFKNYFEIKII